MKKLIAAIVLAFATITPAHAGDTLFGSIGDAVMKGRNALRDTIPTTVKALESDGGNFRYYEWTAPQNRNIICWTAAGTQKGAGGCYPKETVR